MTMKHWKIATMDAQAAEQLRQSGVEPLCAKILAARGAADTAGSLLGRSEELFDPYLLADMDRAVERIQMALENGEVIVVYGDYDCDGVTSTALLYSYLEAVGANVLHYIPDREVEGYGLNCEAITFLANVRSADLIITVDNGVTAHGEIEFANSLGIDVVVTDHHQPKETLPNAVAVIDPHRADCPSPFKALSGVGVAFKLVCALEGDDGTELLEHYGDLLTLGTVGDVVELYGDNRTFVQRGLELLSDSSRPGIRALIRAAGLGGKLLNSTNVAFGLVPRINAAGRMGDVYDALELLLTDDDDRGEELAELLNGYNLQRKETENRILQEILEQIRAEPLRVQQRAIVLTGEGWHHGVVGILCSKLVERFGRPAFLISTGNGEGRSSGRGIEGLSVIEAVSSCGDLLTRYGGHAQAAGFSLPQENIPAFTERFLAFFRERYPQMPFHSLAVDCIVEPQELDMDGVLSLAKLEPFGAGNPSPVFAILGARLDGIHPMAQDRHLRLSCSKNGQAFQVVCFGLSSKRLPYQPGQVLDLVVSAEINTYRGSSSVSLRMLDLRPHDFPQEEIFGQGALYERFLCAEAVGDTSPLCPTREDVAVVYRFLRRQGGFAHGRELLYLHLRGSGISYGKVCAALDILLELGLITASDEAGTLQYQMVVTNQKVDLNRSRLLQRLQNMEAGEAI